MTALLEQDWHEKGLGRKRLCLPLKTTQQQVCSLLASQKMSNLSVKIRKNGWAGYNIFDYLACD
jgi:hypothetical protein